VLVGENGLMSDGLSSNCIGHIGSDARRIVLTRARIRPARAQVFEVRLFGREVTAS
jgi:hypothetical protein